MATRYIPLGNKHDGVIAVAACATLVYKRSANERASTSRWIMFLTSNHGTFLLSLIAGDLFQAIGFNMKWTWIVHGGLPSSVSEACTTQAVLIHIGNLASAFSSLAIELFIFSIFVFSYTPPNRFVYGSITYCGIAQPYRIWRLWLHYLWLFLVAGINLLAYSVIVFQILRRRWRALSSSKKFGTPAAPTTAGANLGGSTRIAAIMLIYPFVYLPRGVCSGLSGTINCRVYASTRSIVSFSSLRRKGFAATGAGMGHITQGGIDGFGPTISVHRPSMADLEASMISGSLISAAKGSTRSATMRTMASNSIRERNLSVLSSSGGGTRSNGGKIPIGSWNESLGEFPYSRFLLEGRLISS
ncbi:BQ2448_1732 [Microbotryum intermedium]|uniref:BQ2448_1732 protein n=1 Tax=Microbotryum intermedium TaxID=269621 RepID=A0A238FGR4_9BASI|nr:BQ2448_1732 [Microbotryum intermedium]